MSPTKTRCGKLMKIRDRLPEVVSQRLSTSPVEKQQKMMTRRRVANTSSLESDTDQQSPQLNKTNRRRRTALETPSKVTRSRKKAQEEDATIDKVDSLDVTVDASIVAKRRRGRKTKGNDASANQTSTIADLTLDESSNVSKKTRSTRARKKPSKRDDTKSSNEDTLINGSTAINVTIIENFTTNEDTAPISDEDAEVQRVSSQISRGNLRSRNSKIRLEDFTPESSPITVPLTPHRTTKTPRKSPMNLSSPKTHADAPQKLSKTPRKLPVVVESPIPSDTASNQSTPRNLDSPTQTHDSSTKKDNSLEKRDSSAKKPHKSPLSRKSPAKSPHSPSKLARVVRKFSKSPKIVLRSPKTKSTRSKTPRVTASKVKRTSLPKRASKSPQMSGKSPALEKSGSSRKTKTKVSPKKSTEPTSPESSANKTNNSEDSSTLQMSLHLTRIDSPSQRESRLSSRKSSLPDVTSPMVILEKIPPELAESPKAFARSSPRRLPPNEPSEVTPARSPGDEKRTSLGGESPHRTKSSVKKRGPVTDIGTPLRPTDSPGAKQNAGKSMIIASSSTPVDITRARFGTNVADEAMTSSTPRERVRRSINLSPSLNIRSEMPSSPANEEVPAGCSTMIAERRSLRRSFRIDDESYPNVGEGESVLSSQGTTVTPLDGTYEVNKTSDATLVVENELDKSANGTYELAEPKTPNLRRKAAKRSLSDLDNSGEDRVAKRSCRVRFASPEPNARRVKDTETEVGRSRSATPGHRTGVKRTSQNANFTNAFALNASDGKARRRSNSVTNVSLIKTPTVEKRRSNSVSDARVRSSRTAEIASVDRLSKPKLSISAIKKTEVKTPVARKAPNFAQIHQKKFAQMESLVDAKKRVEKRHAAMSSKIPTNMSKVNSKAPTKSAVSTSVIAPVVAVNGGYNRYGFKLRKDDATKMVTQKQPTHTGQKKQNENRLLLKGVRTNRRFDLIMKARNINL